MRESWWIINGWRQLVLSMALLFNLSFVNKVSGVNGKIEHATCAKSGNQYVVWGTSELKTGVLFSIDIYDSSLVFVKTFSKEIQGFSNCESELFFQSLDCFEFIIYDIPSKKSVFLTVNRKLIEIFSSRPIFTNDLPQQTDKIFLTPQYKKKCLAYSRIGNKIYALVQDSSEVGRDSTSLQMFEETKYSNWPTYKMIWKRSLSFEHVEYASFIADTMGTIYLYINANTWSGSQYIYCFNSENGKINFRTTLALDSVKACLYSNSYLDPRTLDLFIGGTGLLVSSAKNSYKGFRTEPFIIKLNKEGKLIAGKRVPGNRDNSPIGINRIRCINTISRFTSLSLLKSDSLSYSLEYYSLLQSDNGMLDTNYHCSGFSAYIVANSFQTSSTVKTVSIVASFESLCSFSGVNHFSGSELELNLVPAVNLNNLCAFNSEQGHFICACQTGYSSQKVLIKRSYQIDSLIRDVYFYFIFHKEGQNNFSSQKGMSAVAGQDILINSRFFPMDSKTIVRFIPEAKGYSLAPIAW